MLPCFTTGAPAPFSPMSTRTGTCACGPRSSQTSPPSPLTRSPSKWSGVAKGVRGGAFGGVQNLEAKIPDPPQIQQHNKIIHRPIVVFFFTLKASFRKWCCPARLFLSQFAKLRAHKRAITFLTTVGSYLVTGGADGFVRFFDSQVQEGGDHKMSIMSAFQFYLHIYK